MTPTKAYALLLKDGTMLCTDINKDNLEQLRERGEKIIKVLVTEVKE